MRAHTRIALRPKVCCNAFMDAVPKQTIKFLIGSNNEQLRSHFSNYVKKHFGDTLVYEAKDGAEALQKIQYDPPHIAILDSALTRRSTHHIIESLSKNSKTDAIQVIIVHYEKKLMGYEDLVAAGMVQTAAIDKNLDKVVASIYKAMNRLNPDTKDFSMRFIRKGEILLREGEKGDRLYILKKGKLSAFLGQQQGRHVLGNIEPGEFVGEMAYINGEPRVASVIADEDSELVEFNIATFDQIIFKKPSWMKAMLSTLSRRVKALNKSKED